MKTKIYRQGDVLIECVQINIEKSAKPEGRIILAHGETTGHAHEITEVQHVTHFAPIETGKDGLAGAMLLSLSAPANLVHQEHGTIALPKGTYRVTRQREYTPEAIRNVAD